MHRTTLAIVMAAAVAACGGGGGGDNAAATPTAPAATALTLTGIAATGAAIVSGAVEVKCQAGTGSATTNASGSFTVSVTGGSLPCVVRVTTTNGSVLHSVAEGSGTSATVNISPLTELIVAQAAGGTAASLYAVFDASAQARVSAAALTSARAAVATALQSVVSLAGVDPIKDTMIAGSGVGLDGRLDTLGAALTAARMSLAAVSAAIVANGSAAASVIATQVRPATTSCASARSGSYRVINPNESTDALKFRRVTFNAIALTQTEVNGTVSTASAVAGRPCQFTADGGSTTLVVSSAGVMVNRYITQDGSSLARLAFGVPEQIIPLADLAGTWNSVEIGPRSGVAANVNDYAVLTVSTSGAVSAGLGCDRLQACTPWVGAPGTFSLNANGGLNYADGSGSGARFFAYRAASGDLAMFGLSSDGNFIVLSKQRTLALPSVGATASLWDVAISNLRVAESFVDTTTTVSAVNSTAGTYALTLGSGRVDTFAINNPRAGLQYRAANSCRSSSNAAVSCNGVIAMPLPGMGLSVDGSSVDGTDFFGVIVDKPAGS